MEHRLQHYVPAAYLQFFDLTGCPRGRDSELHVCSVATGKRWIAKANKLARKAFCYARNERVAAENYFGEFEGDWSLMVGRVLAGRPGRRDAIAALFLLQASYFALRNPAFENASSEERIVTYKKAVELFWREVYLDGVVPGTLVEARDKLLSRWQVHLLPSLSTPFITSDNPVVLLSGPTSSPCLVFLPISPKWAVLATLTGAPGLSKTKTNDEDVKRLNSYTTINCMRDIYGSTPFDDDDLVYCGSGWTAARSSGAPTATATFRSKRSPTATRASC